MSLTEKQLREARSIIAAAAGRAGRGASKRRKITTKMAQKAAKARWAKRKENHE